MSDARSRPESQALLAHRDFVRGLAMKLVFDEHAADDVVQATWPAGTRELRFVLKAGFEASGQLLDASGSGVGTVDLRAAPKGCDLWVHARTDESGSFKMHALPAAESVVEAFRSTKDGLLWIPVGTVSGGEKGVGLKLP